MIFKRQRRCRAPGRQALGYPASGSGSAERRGKIGGAEKRAAAARARSRDRAVINLIADQMTGRFDYGRRGAAGGREGGTGRKKQMEADEGERGRVESGSSGRHVHRS